MRKIASSLAVMAIISISDTSVGKAFTLQPSDNLAAQQGGKGDAAGRQRRGKGQFGGNRGSRDAQGKGAQGPGGQAGPAGRIGQGRRGPGGGQNGDPAAFVGKMIERFDQDGDQKLDAQELAALLQEMRQRRGAGGGPGAGRPGTDGSSSGRPGRRPQGDRARSKRDTGSDQLGAPGGDKPKRPGT